MPRERERRDRRERRGRDNKNKKMSLVARSNIIRVIVVIVNIIVVCLALMGVRIPIIDKNFGFALIVTGFGIIYFWYYYYGPEYYDVRKDELRYLYSNIYPEKSLCEIPYMEDKTVDRIYKYEETIPGVTIPETYSEFILNSIEANRTGEYDHDCEFPPELYGIMLPPLEEELSMEEEAEEYFEEIDNFVLAIENMKDK